MNYTLTSLKIFQKWSDWSDFVRFLCLLFCMSILSICCNAQVKLNHGIALTEFVFQDPMGAPVIGLKRDVGAFLSSSYSFDNHNSSKKLLKPLNFDLGIQLVQLNAVGDIQLNTINYQTNFLGVHSKIGYSFKLPLNSSLNIQGIMQLNKILQGNQLIGGKYYDISNHPQFSSIQPMGGFGFEFEKSVSNLISLNFSYQKIESFNVKEVGVALLNFNSSLLTFGIHFKPSSIQ
jgi:hypothetical protein